MTMTAEMTDIQATKRMLGREKMMGSKQLL